MNRLIKRFKEWRNRRFRERIDRVYFGCDVQGNRYFRGNLRVVRDPETGAGGNIAASNDVWIAGSVRVTDDVLAGGNMVAALSSYPAGREYLKPVRDAVEIKKE